MNRINKEFSHKFGGHWIKVKFYIEKPDIKEIKRIKDTRFCQATKEAIMHPVILDRDSISCKGAQYAFGWRLDNEGLLSDNCLDKNQAQTGMMESVLSGIHHLKRPFKYIGLNTDGEPDLIMSYMQPEEIMGIIKFYNYQYGKTLVVPLSSMMSICSGIAVRTYSEGKISLSFGCSDSRKYANIGRNNLAIGIPKRLLKKFISE